jgi:hypothetical protein
VQFYHDVIHPLGDKRGDDNLRGECNVLK